MSESMMILLVTSVIILFVGLALANIMRDKTSVIVLTSMFVLCIINILTVAYQIV